MGLLLVGLLLVIIFHVVFAQNAVASERRKWDQELMQRRAAEQSRINEWENQFLARQHQETARRDEWEVGNKNLCNAIQSSSQG